MSSPKPPRRRSKLRTWSFRIVALLFPVLALGLSNLALYLVGFGVETRLVIPAANGTTPGLMRFNPRADLPNYPQLELRGPEPRTFQIPKPTSTLRIVVVGESTVQGFPLPSEIAFPRQMELLLSKQLPERKVEVLNAGIVGISSFGVIDLAEQSLEADPDAIVAYFGHNEFYGPDGAASSATGLSPTLYRLSIPWRRWRLAQWMFARDRYRPQTGPLTRALARDTSIAIDSATYRRAVAVYQYNLNRLVDVTTANRVRLVLCTPASNLKNQSPIQSVGRPDITPDAKTRRDQLLDLARSQLEAGRVDEAQKAIAEAASLDPRFAIIEFRRAQAFESSRQKDEAYKAYELARDLDGCRFRSPSDFIRIVRETAAAHADNVTLVDLVEQLRIDAKDAAPGRDFFVEHVHYDVEGQWYLARLIARKIVEDVCRTTWNSDAEPTIAERNQALGIVPQDDLVACYLASFLLSEPPLDAAPDSRLEIDWLKRRIAEARKQIPADESAIFDRLSNSQKTDDLLVGLATGLLELGETQRALEMFDRETLRRPWYTKASLGAAECLIQLGRTDEALRRIDRALEVAGPERDQILQYRRLVEQAEGRTSELGPAHMLDGPMSLGAQ
ncbi:MAG TPA: tetratricopeptide repeat protein [Pirellulaceae bacterium]|nr:tetratricopeptide repeat protein [Pirellulaceae bacterium]